MQDSGAHSESRRWRAPDERARRGRLWRVLIASAVAVLGFGCDDQPPRLTTEFMADPPLLEATLSRCNADRDATRYDAECSNARRAAARVAAQEDAVKKRALDKESERKRAALRARTDQIDAVRAAEEAAHEEASDYDAQWYGDQPAAGDPVSQPQQTPELETPPPVIEPAPTVANDDLIDPYDPGG